jgi:hypothetical protein
MGTNCPHLIECPPPNDRTSNDMVILCEGEMLNKIILYKTIPSVNNYTPSGITPTFSHHLRYVVEGDYNHPYEVTIITYGIR